MFSNVLMKTSGCVANIIYIAHIRSEQNKQPAADIQNALGLTSFLVDDKGPNHADDYHIIVISPTPQVFYMTVKL